MSIINITQLHQLLLAANKNETRQNATLALQEFVLNQPNALQLLLEITNDESKDEFVRLLASILFKNHVKNHWLTTDSSEHPIALECKASVKAVVIELLLKSKVNIQNQLLEALSYIAASDFPNDWSDLLPNIVQKMTILSNNYAQLTPLLKVINVLFQKYRNESKSNPIISQLLYIFPIFAQPYLELFVKTGKYISDAGSSLAGDQLKLLFEAVNLQLKIFLSLSSVDLPEFFEDNISSFAQQFKFYLMYQTNSPLLIQSPNEQDPSLLSQVHTDICEIINLYAQIYDDEFQEYLQPFVECVWVLLSKTSNEVYNDSLTYAAIQFLSTVSMGIKHNLFENVDILSQICTNIVTPNIKLRESDIELYEDNPVEYINRDIEGSDSDTRRRASIELVKGLRKYYEQQVTQLLSVDINKLLQQYNANPAENWMSKDCAIFLVTALAVKSGEQTNSLVPITQFFASEIAPELTKPKNQPILIADCLKFITIFRTQLPNYTDLLRLVIPCLKNEDYIIHTYASVCIDRLLTVKDNGVLRLTPDFVVSILGDLLPPLVGVFAFKPSQQNERTMRCIVRIILSVIGRINLPMTVDLLKRFVQIIMVEADNPTSFNFNHYCFEVVGSLLKSFADNPEVFQIVTPLIQYVLAKDVQEFSPYVFQLLSVLVENASPQHFQTYRDMFPSIYHPNLWKRTANIPALVRLVQAYLKKDGPQIVQNNQFLPILGVFQQLIASPANDHEGFYLLESIVENLPYELYEPQIISIFQIILGRISQHKTDKLLRCFTIFLGLFIHKISIAKVIKIVNTVKVGLWSDVIAKVWIVIYGKVTGKIEKKIISVAMTEMLCSPEMYTSIQGAWIHILNCQYKVLSNINSSEATVVEEAGGADELYIDSSTEGYAPSFTQLEFTKKQDIDPIPQITDAKKFFKDNFTPLYTSHRETIDGLLLQCPDVNIKSIL